MRREKNLTRLESNSLCRKCVRTCRQPAAARLIDCPRFQHLPFKVEEPRFSQLDLFSEK